MRNRLVRVCEIIKRELGAIVAKEMQFEVPLVTIHSVDITPDLKNAHVFVSAIGNDSERAAVLREFEERRAFIQGALAKRVVIKQTPHLHFHIDRSLERGTRVLAIMDELGLDISPPSKSSPDTPPTP